MGVSLYLHLTTREEDKRFPTPARQIEIVLVKRYDVLIDLDQAGRYMLHDHVESAVPNDGAYMDGLARWQGIYYLQNGIKPSTSLERT